jgi:hypothetical protein
MAIFLHARSGLRTTKDRIRRTILGRSQLDMLIPPEIVDDDFSRVIREVAAKPEVRIALEIGSSNGAGSTASLVAGMSAAKGKHLYCLELSVPRFKRLEKRYKDFPWVHCLNLPSVPVERMPREADVAAFFSDYPDSPIHQFTLEEVQRWLRQDIAYMHRVAPAQNGVEVARRAAGVPVFDLVLIDGSEFTGEAELTEVYGARYILLDDVTTFKNRASYQRLSHDPKYELLAENRACRFGFAAFQLR